MAAQPPAIPPPGPPTPAAALTPDLFVALVGSLEADVSQQVLQHLGPLIGATQPHIHLMIQSTGGLIGEGIFLHNLFRRLPLTVYNMGQVSSAAVLAYLGATNRRVSTNGAFMVHKTSCRVPGALLPGNAFQHHAAAQSLVVDDARNEAVLQANCNLPQEIWQRMLYGNVYISGQDAVAFGIAHAIGEFNPPPGVQVTRIVPANNQP